MIGIVWEIIAGIMIIFDVYVLWAALSLIPFTLISVTIFHDFWNKTGELKALHKIIFITHTTATLGALLLLTHV